MKPLSATCTGLVTLAGSRGLGTTAAAACDRTDRRRPTLIERSICALLDLTRRISI
jgi:hypothetical protein